MRRAEVTAIVAIGMLVVGCAQPVAAPAPAARRGPDDPALSTEGLVVHLVWDGSADLDLVLTDPAGATFSAEQGGPVVARDVGCHAGGQRIDGGLETATVPMPTPGRYRVGVDYAAPCGDAEPVAYRILLDTGGRRRVVTGTATPLQRTPNAAEIVLP